MKYFAIKLIIIAALFGHYADAAGPAKTALQPDALVTRIPRRPIHALTGSEFVRYVSIMDPQQREQAIREEILKGNVPDFLRRLVPVELSYTGSGNNAVIATIFAMPDYLAIGSNDDYVRIPMNLYSAMLIAKQLGFVLPTTKMVDAIYAQSTYHLAPQPLPAGPSMRSTEYYRLHNEMIERQMHGRGIPSGGLISGHKKDVVLSNRLRQHDGRIAIYGWHRLSGIPIQPLSTVHGATYADYSHGIRLISDVAIVDGEMRPVYDVLGDYQQANVLTREGPTGQSLWKQILRADPLGVDATH